MTSCSTGGNPANGGVQPAPAAPEDAPREVSDAELALLARYTARTDLAALREHVLAQWRRAVSGTAPVYCCVRTLMFLEPRISGHPSYPRAQRAMQQQRKAGTAPLWLDIGAAVGTDVRQLRLDGLTQHEVVALDIPESQHYWQVGLDMYLDAARPPCQALFGDICDDAVLPAVPAAPAQAGPPEGQRWDDIAQLAGRVQVASCSAVLHCLGREQVEQLLRKACLLLRPGGLLLGSTLGAPTPRPWEAAYQAGRTRWLHSAQSLAALLRELGYEEVEVAPTRWRDVDRSTAAVKDIMRAHVGPQVDSEERCMLAFTALKPARPPEAAGGQAEAATAQ